MGVVYVLYQEHDAATSIQLITLAAPRDGRMQRIQPLILHHQARVGSELQEDLGDQAAVALVSPLEINM